MKREQISMMNEMNRRLHISPGKEFWMDWKFEANEKARPVRVVVDSVYPHVIIVKDKYGRYIGIPAASAALDLRLTRELPSRSPKEPTQKKIPLDREKIIKGYLEGKSGRQIAREIGRSDVSVSRIIREWKRKQGGARR